MVKITDLPAAQTPLNEGDLTFVFQGGQLKSVNQGQFGFTPTVADELAIVTANIDAINTVATNIDAILAVDFTANTVSFDPIGLTYLTAIDLQTLGQQIDAEFVTFNTHLTGTLANYALKASGLGQFGSTSSASLASVLSDETGTGKVVFNTAPTLIAPVLGAASATTLNKVTVTQPATGSTLTIQDGFTLTASSNATVSGTNTGDQTLSDATITTSDITTNNVSITKHGFAPKAPNDATKYLDGTGAYTVPAGGIAITDATISVSDVTTNNVTSTAHGWTPKSPSNTSLYLNGAATPTYTHVSDADLSITNITTNNVSTSAHGFAPKLPNDASKYLDGTGAYTTPPGATGTVQTVSVVTANGVSGSVANPTVTPAITLTLGAIVPTTVNKVTVTAPATGSTLTIDDGFTLHASGNATVSGTNTGDQNLFGSIPVSGQTTVTPGSTSQALTLAAGANMTITTNNATKTITFAAAGGGGGSTLADGNYGDVTASGSGTTITINAGVVTNADLAGSIAASKFVGTDIATVGTVTAGTWQGTKVGLAYGGTNADLSATGAAHNVLKQSSSGAAITVGQLAFSDLSGSATGAQLPNPSSSTLGGIESFAAQSNKWINTISTSGVPSATQPATTDLSDIGSFNLSTSGTGSLGGALNMNSHKINNVTDPSSAQDAATKNYVDLAVAALDGKDACQGATTAPLAAYTYNNGSSGVGATITLTTAAVLIVGGYTVALGDRVLVKNETGGNAPNNGIYTVTTLGVALGAQAVLTRSLDFDQASNGINGALTFIQNGTNANQLWYCSTFGTINFGVTNINFAQFTGTTYTADGTTLTLTGTTFSVNTGYTGQTSLTTLGTIGTGTWQGTKVGLAYGGTNADLSGTGGASQVLKQTSSGGAVTVAQLAASDLSNGTSGSGAVALVTSPVFTTPNIGAATATTVNKVTLTQPAAAATLTIANNKVLTASNTLTFTGTDGSSAAFGTGGTVTYTSNNLGVFAATSSAQFAGVISDATGSGAVVLAVSPALTGSPTAPTQAATDNSTKISSTAFAQQAATAMAFYGLLGAF